MLSTVRAMSRLSEYIEKGEGRASARPSAAPEGAAETASCRSCAKYKRWYEAEAKRVYKALDLLSERGPRGIDEDVWLWLAEALGGDPCVECGSVTGCECETSWCWRCEETTKDDGDGDCADCGSARSEEDDG